MSATIRDRRAQHSEYAIGAGAAIPLYDTVNRLALFAHNSDGSHKGFYTVSTGTDPDGVAFPTLQEIIDNSLVSTNTTLLITDVQTLAGGTTISHPIKLVKGGYLNCASGTVTINGPFEAGLYSVFTGAGSFVFGSGTVSEVYPEWWGAKADGVTSCTTALNSAISSLVTAGGGVVRLSPGTYMGHMYVYEKHNTQIIGSGRDATILKANDNTKNMISTWWSGSSSPLNWTNNLTVKDLTIDGNYGVLTANTLGAGGTTDDNFQLGIYFFKVNGSLTENVTFQNIWVTNDWFYNNIQSGASETYSIIRNCKFKNIGDKQITLPSHATVYNTHLEIDNFTNNILVEGCAFIGSDATGTINKNLVNCNMNGADVCSRNIIFRNNYFRDQATGIYAYGGLYDWKITNNTFLNIIEAVYLWEGTYGMWPKKPVIDGNHVTNTINGSTGRFCIRVNGYDPTIINNQLSILNSGGGIRVSGPTSQHSTAIISNNHVAIGKIIDDSSGAIMILSGGIISNNNIECSDNSGPGEGIHIYTASFHTQDSAVVTGNILNGLNILHDEEPYPVNSRITRYHNKYTSGASNGTVTLASGTATVSTTEICAGDTVRLSRLTQGVSAGHVWVDTANDFNVGVSFVIHSSSGTDSGMVFWEIVH